MPAPRRPVVAAEANSHEIRALKYMTQRQYELMLVGHAETTITGFITSLESFLEFLEEEKIKAPVRPEHIRLWGLSLVREGHACPAQEIAKVIRWFTLPPGGDPYSILPRFDAGVCPAKALFLVKQEVSRVEQRYTTTKQPPMRRGGLLEDLPNYQWMQLALWVSLGVREKTFLALSPEDVEMSQTEIRVHIPHDKVEGTARRVVSIGCGCVNGRKFCLLHSGKRAMKVEEFMPPDPTFLGRFMRKTNLSSHSFRTTNALWARYVAERELRDFALWTYLQDRGWATVATWCGYCAHLEQILNPATMFPVYLPEGKGALEVKFPNRAAAGRAKLTDAETKKAEQLAEGTAGRAARAFISGPDAEIAVGKEPKGPKVHAIVPTTKERNSEAADLRREIIARIRKGDKAARKRKAESATSTGTADGERDGAEPDTKRGPGRPRKSCKEKTPRTRGAGATTAESGAEKVE